MRNASTLKVLVVLFALAAVTAVRGGELFSVRTEPAIDGLVTAVRAQEKEGVWRIAVSAKNTTATNVVFKLVLAAEPRLAATRYLIPGTLYNGNEFVGKSIPSDGRSFSMDMPNGWQKDGQPWIFAGDRCSIPSCTISENTNEVFALFASDGDPKSLTSSCSLEKLADGSFRHLIYWPVTEAPVSYTDKRKFSARYDTYLTLRPGETFRAKAFACRGTPPWPNYGFAAVFPVAWKCLKHDTVAQKSVDETIRLDRAFHRWCRRRNEKGSWFSGAHNDKMFGMGYMNIPKSREGYTLADYERNFSLDRWMNDDVEQSKLLKPGEYLKNGCAADIGFASQTFQKARVTIAYGLKEGNEEDVAFGLEVLRSWIRTWHQPNGFFCRTRTRKDGRTFTDASEIGWAISELTRTAELLDAHGRDGREFADVARKLVAALLKALPDDGGLGSTWDYKTGKLLSQAGDCGGFVLMGLARYWHMTRDAEVKSVVDRAFDYYYSRDIDRFECNGGAMDCSSVDREGIQPFFSAAIEMWKATKEPRYLEYARKAGWYFLSWLYLQNPVYGPETDFSIYNWRPAGSTIVGTEHPGLDDYGGLLLNELMTLAKTDGNPLWREAAGLIWRNGTQGFSYEGRQFFHTLERPIGAKQEAWFMTRWSKYRTGERKRGSLNDHLMAWGGTYRLASLLELDADDRAWLEAFPAVEPRTEGLLRKNCADPWACRDGDAYFLTQTGKEVVQVRTAKSLEALADLSLKGTVAYDARKDPILKRLGYAGVAGVWSPELHHFDEADMPGCGGWYMFVALVDAGPGDVRHLQSVVLKSLSGSPCGPYGHPVTGRKFASMLVQDADGGDFDKVWNGGWSVLRLTDGEYRGNYALWVQERGRGTPDFEQTLHIARLQKPWQLAGEPALIAEPTQFWETVGSGRTKSDDPMRMYRPKVIEGVTALYGDRPDEVYLMYSGSGYWTNYGLGQITWTGKDPLLKASWIKYDGNPVFGVADAKGVHRPGVNLMGAGHASYVTDEKGRRLAVYHAYPYNAGQETSVIEGETLKPRQKAKYRNAYVAPLSLDRTKPNGVGQGVVTIGAR